jgi:hypothetical protein
MLDRSKPEFKPIEKDERSNGKQFFCIGCGSLATQTALFKVEGAIIVERYCDKCASKVNVK